MNEKEALAYASNILRTLAADDSSEPEPWALFYAARQLDQYAKDMEN